VFAIVSLIAVVLFATLALPILRALASSGQLPEPLVKLVGMLKSVRLVHLACLLGVLVMASALGPGGGSLLVGLLMVAVLLTYLAFWIHEFLFLMNLTDQDFPGRYDKPIWAAVLIVLGPLGLWVFHRYRVATWLEPAAAGGTSAPSAKPASLHELF
jgi:hypothetical protein